MAWQRQPWSCRWGPFRGRVARQGPSAQFPHPPLLKARPCSVEGEHGAEASEAEWCNPSPKYLLLRRRPLGLWWGLAASQAPVPASRQRETESVGASFLQGDWGFEQMLLVEMTAVVSWYSKAPSPSPCHLSMLLGRPEESASLPGGRCAMRRSLYVLFEPRIKIPWNCLG